MKVNRAFIIQSSGQFTVEELLKTYYPALLKQVDGEMYEFIDQLRFYTAETIKWDHHDVLDICFIATPELPPRGRNVENWFLADYMGRIYGKWMNSVRPAHNHNLRRSVGEFLTTIRIRAVFLLTGVIN